MEKEIRKNRAEWTERETEMLFNVWEKKAFDLQKVKRTTKVFKAIKSDLELLNVKKGIQEIRNKVKNLTSKYRAETKLMAKIGAINSAWKHYDTIHHILGDLMNKSDPLSNENDMFGELSSGDESKCSNTNEISQHSPLPIEVEAHDSNSTFSTVHLPSDSKILERRAKKRKLAIVHEDILMEIKRANKISEEHLKTTNSILNNINQVMQRGIELQEKLLSSLKIIKRKK